MEKTLFSVNETCRLLCITKPTLLRLEKEGKIQSFKITEGRKVFEETEIKRYIENARSKNV